MTDEQKTKQELIQELDILRQRVADIEQSELARNRAEEEQRLSRETAEQLAGETAVIADIGRIISSTMNIAEVYERFAEAVRKVVPFDRIVINIIDVEMNTVINEIFLLDFSRIRSIKRSIFKQGIVNRLTSNLNLFVRVVP